MAEQPGEEVGMSGVRLRGRNDLSIGNDTKGPVLLDDDSQQADRIGDWLGHWLTLLEAFRLKGFHGKLTVLVPDRVLPQMFDRLRRGPN